MVQLENGACRVAISEDGCELTSFFDKERSREYLWQAGPAWRRHAPVLFPIIGGLVDGSYLVDGERYELPPHGFARDRRFEVVRADGESVEMRLAADDRTRACYPFEFELRIGYRLDGKRLVERWEVENRGSSGMPFSIGAHPAFMLAEGTDLADYELRFGSVIPLRTLGVAPGRLASAEKEVLGEPSDRLQLASELFSRDTLIFEEGLESLSLACPSADYEVEARFPQMPLVAVWACPDEEGHAPFVCLEPWCGINDLAGHPVGELSDKYLIERAEPGETWARELSFEIK